MKPGDLVQSKKHKNSIGIVTEIFSDLSAENPWVRVLFTHPTETYQWCKMNGLSIANETKIKEKDKIGFLDPATRTGSL